MTKVAARTTISIGAILAAFAVFIALLVMSPSVRAFAQDILLHFRERPFSVVHIDGGVFESGLRGLGLSPSEAATIEYETAPSLRVAGEGDRQIRRSLPRNPGGISSEPYRAVWGPVSGTLTMRLEGIPIGQFGGSSTVGYLFEMQAAAVTIYAEDATVLAALQRRDVPSGNEKYLVYGEIAVPQITPQGANDLPAMADALARFRVLPARFRGQIRVVADWLRFLIPTAQSADDIEVPPPVLIEGLAVGDIVVWESDGLVGILIGNIGGDSMLDIAKRSG
ncbi:MAG: hypothetical protein OXG46_04465 [Chloroflexi bacterium]|nr:hypothetical protein [Chloroflexota bacterium]MCY3938586.1 hypothetical protein [Chloroflexota bacterium]